MTVSELIIMKLTLALQTCTNNYNTEFHENPTNGGVTGNRTQTERQMWPPHIEYSSLYCQECLNAVKSVYNKTHNG